MFKKYYFFNIVLRTLSIFAQFSIDLIFTYLSRWLAMSKSNSEHIHTAGCRYRYV